MTYLEKCDFISFTPTLLVNGSSRIKTGLGGFLSLIIVAVTVTSIYFFSTDLVFKKNPSVNYNKYFSQNEHFLLTKKSFFLLFGMRYKSGLDIQDPRRYYEAKALRYYYRDEEQPDGSNKTILETTPVPVRPCIKEDVAMYEEYKDMPVEKYWCLGEDASVEMFAPLGGAFDNSYLNIYLRRCQEEVASQGGYTCATQEEFDDLFPSSDAFMRFETYFADHDSFTKPIKSYFETVFQDNTPDIYNRTYLNFGKISYATDEGLLFEEIKKLEYFSFQSSSYSKYEMPEKYKAIKETFHQITVTFGGSGLHDNYRRNYKKVQNVMADIGGFSKGCMALAHIINYLFSKSTFMHKIFNEYFLSYSRKIDKEEKLSLTNSAVSKINLKTAQNKLVSTKTIQIGGTQLKKEDITPLSVLKYVVFCKKNADSSKTKRILASYNNLMDVRTFIATKQKVELLKTALLSPTDANILDSLDFLLDLDSLQDFDKAENKIKKLDLLLKRRSIENQTVDKFLRIDQAELQNFMS